MACPWKRKRYVFVTSFQLHLRQEFFSRHFEKCVFDSFSLDHTVFDEFLNKTTPQQSRRSKPQFSPWLARSKQASAADAAAEAEAKAMADAEAKAEAEAAAAAAATAAGCAAPDGRATPDGCAAPDGRRSSDGRRRPNGSSATATYANGRPRWRPLVRVLAGRPLLA